MTSLSPFGVRPSFKEVSGLCTQDRARTVWFHLWSPTFVVLHHNKSGDSIWSCSNFNTEGICLQLAEMEGKTECQKLLLWVGCLWEQSYICLLRHDPHWIEWYVLPHVSVHRIGAAECWTEPCWNVGQGKAFLWGTPAGTAGKWQPW